MKRINHSLSAIIETAAPKVILVDASGVLYNDTFDLSGVGPTVETLSQSIPIWVVTNNTSHSIPQISAHLSSLGIHIPTSHIISSGLGLSVSPELYTLILGKSVYTFGHPSSQWYSDLAGGVAVEDPDLADVIVLAASIGEATFAKLEEVAQSLRKRNRPVICVNPDHYIQTGHDLYPVMGYYAAQLAADLSLDIVWMGKPDSRFSPVVAEVLKKANITLDADVWFFDDNPKNVARLTHDLGISGATVMDTGLCKGLSCDEIAVTFGTIPPIRIPRFTL